MSRALGKFASTSGSVRLEREVRRQRYTIEQIREYAFGFAQHSEGAQMIAQLLEELHTLERDQKGWEDECRLFKEERDKYKNACKRIEEHWDGEDGEIDPVFMAHVAKDALLGI